MSHLRPRSLPLWVMRLSHQGHQHKKRNGPPESVVGMMGTGGVGESLGEHHVAGLVAEMVRSVDCKLGKLDLRRTEMVTGARFGKASDPREEEIRMLDSIAETAVTSAMKAFADFYPPIGT